MAASRRKVHFIFGLTVVFLLAPFLFKCVVPLEPYPSMIFPGFGTLAKVGDKKTESRIDVELRATTANGDEHTIPRKEFIKPLPPPAAKKLGLTVFPIWSRDKIAKKIDKSTGELTGAVLKKVVSLYLDTQPPTAKESPEIQRWIYEKLTKQLGEPPKTFVIEWQKIKVDRETSETVSTKTLRTIELNFDEFED